jgi:acyl-CoA thioester hydrolase
MSAPFRTTRRVEFGDTDLAGIVHFANFFRYMEAAETEFLRARGLTVAWKEAGVKYGFPRVAAACDYLKPARFEDVLDVTVTVGQVGRKSVTYEFEFSRGGEPVAKGRISAVFCRATGEGQFESLEIPDEVRAKLGE